MVFRYPTANLLLLDSFWSSLKCSTPQPSINHCSCSVAQLCLTLWTPWTVAHQASLSSTLKPMSIELMMPSNHLILCCPLLLLPSIFPSNRSFPMSPLFDSGGRSIGAPASVLPIYIRDWFPLGLTCLISLLFKGLSRVFRCESWTTEKAEPQRIDGFKLWCRRRLLSRSHY